MYIMRRLCMYAVAKEFFLAYLQEWEDEVAQRTEYSAGQRAKMLLSQETMSGL